MNPHIPDRLAQIIEQSLAKDASGRFAETAIFCDRLNAMMVDFDERPDSGKLSRFLRKVFAEDGKKNRTDLSALVEKAVEQEAKAKKEIADALPPPHMRSSEHTAQIEGGSGANPNQTQRMPGKSRVTEEPVRVLSEPIDEGPPIEFAVASLRLNVPEGEDAADRVAEFLAVIEDEVGNRGGRVERRTATGLIAYFDADGSEVDYRLRAVETARKAIDLGRRPGSELALTAGVCAGSVERGVTQASVKAMATAIRRAEKLSSRADGVGCLVDEDVAKNIGDGYVLRRVGESDGSPAFAPVRAASKERSTRSRMAGRTVGRDAERQRLTQRLDEVIGGQGARSSAITGAAGIGKSHLVHDLIRTAATKGASVVVGRCVAAGRHVPFSVFNDVVRDLLGLPDGAGREVTSQRLERVVTELNLASSISANLKPLYAGARAVTAEQIRDIATGLREILGGMAANNKTIVLVIEDLQFADEASRAVIGSLTDLLRRERVLVVITARTDVDDLWLKQRKGVDEIRLAALDDKSILTIAMDRMQLPQISPELGDFLRGKAKGNPYYLLETVRRLNEKGLGGGAGGATNRQDLTAQGGNNEMYSPVIARPRIMGDRQNEAVQRAKQAMAPQIRGFADDIRRLIAFIRPMIHRMLDGMVKGFHVAKKVKKDYDPKTVDSLTRGDD